MKARSTLTKIISLMLCFMLAFSSLVFADTTNDYTGHWAEESIKVLFEKGIVTGYPDGSFKPDREISRAEFMAIVNRAFGFNEKAEISFKDVKKDEWHYEHVARAVKAGYIKGFIDGTMRPTSNISRQEAAVIIARILKLEENADIKVLAMAKDGDKILEWSAKGVAAIISKGYISLNKDGNFEPTKLLTRAEMAVAIEKSYVKQIKKLYTNSGEYTGGNIDGSVKIDNKDITLRDTTINGDLILGEGIGDGNVHLINVTVKGDTIVKGGGENSIIIENCNFSKIIIIKENNKIRILAKGSTKIDKTDVLSGAILESEGFAGEGFGYVAIAEGLDEDAIVQLIGNFESVEIRAAGIQIQASGGTIGNLEVTETAINVNITLGLNSRITTLIANASTTVTGTGSIDTAKLNVSGTTIKVPVRKVEKPDGVTANIIPPSSGGGISTVYVTGVALNESTMNMIVGEVSETLAATVAPANATNKSVTWSSSNPAVATVDINGKVTAVSAGTAAITVTTASGSKTASCTVTVVPVSNPQLFELRVNNMPIGAHYIEITEAELNLINTIALHLTEEAARAELLVTITLEDNTKQSEVLADQANVQYFSADIAALRAKYNGHLSAGKYDFTIRLTNNKGTITERVITVIAIVPVRTITVTSAEDATTVVNGGTLQMSTAISPSNATYPIVIWSIEAGTGLATIDENGLLTATGLGTVRVIAANPVLKSKVVGYKDITIVAPTDNYTALGDSITFGMSAEPGYGYVDLFYNHLKLNDDNSTMELINRGAPGDKSSDILNKLMTDTITIDAVSKAKVITISIGGNNILSPVIDVFAEKFNLERISPDFARNLASALAIADPQTISTIITELQPVLISAVEKFGTDWVGIIGKIKALAPQAEVYATTLYNPLNQLDLFYSIFDVPIQGINEIINTPIADYKVADVYTAFSHYQGTQPLTSFSMLTGNLDPHPTTQGHNVIYEAHLEAENPIPKIALDIEGLTANDGNTIVPLSGTGTSENPYVLTADPLKEGYVLQFAAGSTSNLDLGSGIGLRLKSSTLGPEQINTLVAYYLSKPEPYAQYLAGALAGINPFAVIRNDADKALVLYDGAKLFANNGNAGLGMLIPGNFPAATYTLEGIVGDQTFTYVLKIENPVYVTGVTLNESAMNLIVGDVSEILVATVAPANATNKSLAWSSSNPEVATVDANGKVTAVSAGTATITVTTACGGKTAGCAITVKPESPTIVSLDKQTEVRWRDGILTEEELDSINEDIYLGIQLPESTGTGEDLGQDGNVIRTGYWLRVYLMNNGKEVYCTESPINNYDIGENNIISKAIPINDLKGLFHDSNNYTIYASIEYIKDDLHLESVLSTGVEILYEAIIKVSTITVSSTGDATTVFNGETLQMSAFASPSNATDKTIVWSVATLEGGTATIDQTTGLLTATGIGTVKVTATNPASGVSGTKDITVVLSNETDFIFDAANNTITGYRGSGGDVVIPSTIGAVPVYIIGDYAFSSLLSLRSVTIPEGVKSIGKGAFQDCRSLKSITIPYGVTSIEDGTLANCSGLESVTIPDGVTSIGNSAFQGCNNLISIEIPASATIIGRYAFDKCSSLKSIEIQASVTIISDYAFEECSNLTTITIPESVTSIGHGAFYKCNNLLEAYFYGYAPTMGMDVFRATKTNFTVYYLYGKTGFTTPTWAGYTPVTFLLNDEATLGLVGTSVALDAEGIVTAAFSADKNKIHIAPVSEGDATITVKDAENNEATIAVKVASDKSITLIITKYEPKL